MKNWFIGYDEDREMGSFGVVCFWTGLVWNTLRYLHRAVIVAILHRSLEFDKEVRI